MIKDFSGVGISGIVCDVVVHHGDNVAWIHTIVNEHVPSAANTRL
jgi:hypothetical protein